MNIHYLNIIRKTKKSSKKACELDQDPSEEEKNKKQQYDH